MDLAKKIIVYALGLVALAAVVAAVSAGYLILVEGSEIFGYHYISGGIVEFENEFTEGVTTYSNLVVESHGFDIEIEPQEDNLGEVQVTFVRAANGFTKEAITEFNYNYNYNAETQTIHIAVVEPTDGLMFYSNAVIKIGLPNVTAPKNITVISAGGEITVGQKTPLGLLDPFILETTSLTVENTSAKMVLQNFTVSTSGTLDITNVSGRTYILSDVGVYEENGTRAGNVIINSSIGSFTFGTEDEATMYNIGGNLDITASNAYVKAGNVGGNVSQTGDSGLIQLGKVHEDIYFNTENGEVEIETALKNISINSQFNTIKIGNIGEGLDPFEQFTAVINSTNADVEIGTCYYSLDVTSTRGSLVVDNAFWDVTVNTTYGSVDVTYNISASAYKDVVLQENLKTLHVITTEGNITAKNIKANTYLEVGLSSNATITAEFLEMHGENVVKFGRRESTVKVPVVDFSFSVTMDDGASSDALNILAGDVYRTGWLSAELVDGEYQTGTLNMLAGSSTNKLTITSYIGKINLLTNEVTVE